MATTTAIAKVDPKVWARKIEGVFSKSADNAGKLYNQYINNGGDVVALRTESSLGDGVWKIVSAIASGRVLAAVFVLPEHVRNALMRETPEVQQQLMDEGVDVLTADGSPRRTAVRILTWEEQRMVFGNDGVRTQPQQKQWQDHQLMLRKRRNGGNPSKIGKLDVVVDKDKREIRVTGNGREVVFKPKDLARFMVELS